LNGKGNLTPAGLFHWNSILKRSLAAGYCTNQVGPFKVESLKCCIHFVSIFTFAAVKISENKITVDFSLSRKLKNSRIKQSVQLSAHRFLYYIDIMQEDEMDEELMEWIKETCDKRKIEVAA
jgi:hypothetical protein